MPFNVLRCHECKTFQIHPQTKASKWRCKMCNEKQSFLKVFMSGTAPECRQAVQTLNMRQGDMENGLEVEWGRTGTDSLDCFDDGPKTAYESSQMASSRPGFEVSSHLLTNRKWESPSAVEGEEDGSLALCGPTNTPRLQMASSERKPMMFQAARNYRQEDSKVGPGLGPGSKWSKYLEPVDSDSDDEDDDDAWSSLFNRATTTHPHHRKEILSAHSARQKSRFQVAAKVEENSSEEEEENLPQLGFRYQRVPFTGP